MTTRRQAAGLAALALVAQVLLAAPPVRAESAPDRGRAFEPSEMGPALYGIKNPSEDPERQQHWIEGTEGAQIYVETWLPKKKGRNVPPARVPTIVDVTPYATGQGYMSERARELADIAIPRGYAFAVSHVRGTGESGGCLEQTGPRQIEDTARVIQYLGRDAPWTNGKVGMYGKSYDAETQLSVAGLGDPGKTKYLKAMVPVASVGGQYEWSFMDGVPYLGFGTLGAASYLTVTAEPGDTTGPEQFAQKAECQDEVFVNQSDQSGDLTPFWQERELRPGAPNVRAATLIVHGIHDWNVLPLTEAGFFERLPATTPHKAIIGLWGHDYPNNHTSGIRSEWTRDDWFPMVLDWYDRYLKGIRNGVEGWPTVQIQDPYGQWRVEPDWPFTGGPIGQLALSADGVLGATRPEGQSEYVEAETADSSPPGSEVVYETKPLRERLEITGQPTLDLWVSLDRPDAHVAAKIEAIGADGEPIDWNFAYGFRSARHLEPLVANRFAQAQGQEPPTDKPLRIPLRFYPTDVVVPKGGSLRLTISGVLEHPGKGSSPSGLGTRVTVLHDCDHPSALRFVMARGHAQLLNVLEVDEPEDEPLASSPSPARSTDGGGIATTSVCGKSPFMPDLSIPELTPPRVKIRVSDATPSFGESIAFRVGLGVCKGHRGTTIQLRRKIDGEFRTIANKKLNRRCRARFRVAANFRRATFRSVWARQDDDHRRGQSRAVTVVTH